MILVLMRKILILAMLRVNVSNNMGDVCVFKHNIINGWVYTELD